VITDSGMLDMVDRQAKKIGISREQYLKYAIILFQAGGQDIPNDEFWDEFLSMLLGVEK
jgi:hypothetical protein